MLEITKDTFQAEVADSKVPVLVDFWASWCMPCKMIAPVLEQIQAELGNEKIKIVKVNVDEQQELAAKFGIMSIPTLILFKDGKKADSFLGAMPKDVLLSKLAGSL